MDPGGSATTSPEPPPEPTPPEPAPEELPPEPTPNPALTTTVSGTNKLDEMTSTIEAHLASIGQSNFPTEQSAAEALGISREEQRQHGNGLLAGIYKQQGFDELGTVLSREEFEQLVTEHQLAVGYRGVAGSKYAEAFQTGDYYAGVGVSGDGTYAAFSTVPEGATLPPGGLDSDTGGALGTARSYAGVSSQSITKIALKPDAKVWTMPDVLDAQHEAQLANAELQKQIFAMDGNSPERSAMETKLEVRVLLTSNPGLFAASIGVDAYVAKGSTYTDAAYLVILNRNALIMQKERIDARF
jgi:hypothetical protein